MTELVQYAPTGVVALVLGFFTYRATRAGQRSQEHIQESANRVAETQQALDSQKSIANQYRDMARDAEAHAKAKDEEIAGLKNEVAQWRGLVFKQMSAADEATQLAIDPSQKPTENT